jgi:ribose transport system ATP-binding protein
MTDSPATSPEPLLAVASLSKTFPGQVALDEAKLVVRSGSVHALVGQNGSGKSTLIKILSGYHRPDSGGSVRLLGREIDVHDLSAEDRDRIRIVHQNLALVPTLNVMENLALETGFQTRMGRISWRSQRRHSQRLLAELDLDVDPRTPIEELSPSEKTILCLVRAMQSWDADGGLLILDEPTASLAQSEVDRLFAALRRAVQRGAGVLFVSHRLEEVFEIADEVTVLRDGRTVATFATAEIDRDGLVEAIVGRPLAEFYTEPPPVHQEVVLDIEHLAGQRLDDLTLKVRRGEIVGLTGLLGSGHEEVPDLIFGAAPRMNGKISITGAPVPANPHRALRSGIALVPADRARNGVLASESVAMNVTLSKLDDLARWLWLRGGQERKDVSAWIDKVDLRPADPTRRIDALSGGNQQKVLLARCLRSKPKALVMNEPTQGVDVGAKAMIYELLADAAKNGTAIVVCSGDTQELAAICDRVLVFRRGRVGTELGKADLTSHSIAQEILK